MKKITTIVAVALVSIGLAAAPAEATPRPAFGDYATMAKAYHCGTYFHGQWLRGFLDRGTLGPTVWIHESLTQPHRVHADRTSPLACAK